MPNEMTEIVKEVNDISQKIRSLHGMYFTVPKVGPTEFVIRKTELDRFCDYATIMSRADEIRKNIVLLTSLTYRLAHLYERAGRLINA